MSDTMMKEALRMKLRRLWDEHWQAVRKVTDELDRLEPLDSIERIYPMGARQAHQEACQKLKGNVMTESSFVPAEERIYPIRAQRSKFQPLVEAGIRSFEDLSTRLDGEIG